MSKPLEGLRCGEETPQWPITHDRRQHYPAVVDYVYDDTVELGRGGMAVVYEATPPGGGALVALKRPLPFPLAPERLRREIDALTQISDVHVMAVLDHGVDDEGQPWYAMPLALGSLRALWDNGKLGSDPETVCLQVLEDICAGLGAMHAAQFVHRDVTPNNVLAFSDLERPSGLRWVIADCGLVRRPLGETTEGLTGSVSRLGTSGYMAPESFGDPHSVTAAADVYSLGRVLAGLLTGQRPVLTTSLLPAGPPWRSVIRLLTRTDLEDRPKSTAEALERARELLADLPVSDKVTFRVRIGERGGQLAPRNPLWGIVEDHVDDADFMIDDLTNVKPSAARALTTARPEFAAHVTEKLAAHVVSASASWSGRDFSSFNVHLDWIKSVLEGLIEGRRLDLFSDIAPAYCEAVQAWDRYRHNDHLVSWIAGMQNPAAISMARAIRDSGTVQYFQRIVSGTRISDPTLAAVLGA